MGSDPARARDFAEAIGRLAKTDAVDAAVLAEYAERIRPTPRPRPDADTVRLQALVTRRRQVVEYRAMEANRTNPLADRAVKRSLSALERAFDKELERLGRDIAAAVEASPAWAAKSVRAVLDMGAMSARRHNPVRKAFADRLAKAGKAGKVIITAVARKLEVIADAILQTNRPWQPQVA